MRTIYFSGKDTKTKETVYGYYAEVPIVHGQSKTTRCIMIEPKQSESGSSYIKQHTVDPETVCEFTGLYDSTKWAELTEEEKEGWLKKGYTAEEWQGIPIFENDIVKLWDSREPEDEWKAVVEFGNPNGRNDWGFQLRPITDTGYNTDILLWVDMEEVGIFCKVIDSTHDMKASAELRMQ